MNFAELKEEAEELCDIWGYTNTLRAPNWPKLINRAYKDVCMETDVIRGPEVMFQTVIGQREYIAGGLQSVAYFVSIPGAENLDGSLFADRLGTLCTQEFKSFLDVITADLQRIRPQDENWIRRQDPLWLMANQGIPSMIWSPRPNVVSLFPVPSSVVTVLMYNVLLPAELADENDIPAFWEPFHTAIPLRAAYLHAKKYAKGEAREILAARDSEYNALLAEMKQLQMEDSGMDTPRYVEWPEPDRIFL